MSPAPQPRPEPSPCSLSLDRGRIDRTLEDELLRAGFSVSTVARASGLSVRQFRRLFREQFAACPREMIREIRMRFACGRLLSEASLKEISLELGYRDPAHFCRAFCQFYGASPSQTRWHLRKRTVKRALMSHYGKRMSQNGK